MLRRRLEKLQKNIDTLNHKDKYAIVTKTDNGLNVIDQMNFIGNEEAFQLLRMNQSDVTFIIMNMPDVMKDEAEWNKKVGGDFNR